MLQSVRTTRLANGQATRNVAFSRPTPCRINIVKPSLGPEKKCVEHTAVICQSTLGVNAAAAGGAPAGFKWGADMKNLSIAIGLGVGLWFAPSPAGVSAQAWHLLAIFVATIFGIITTPLPLGAVAMLGLGVSMLTKTLTFTQAFSAFSTEIPCVPASLGLFSCSESRQFFANSYLI